MTKKTVKPARKPKVFYRGVAVYGKAAMRVKKLLHECYTMAFSHYLEQEAKKK